MKNSTLERGGEVLGGMENEDPASTLQTHLDGMFDDELEQAVISMKRLIDASTAQLLVMIGELDRRQIPQNEHILSTKQWLKRFTRMGSKEASGTVKTARALAEMPQVRKAAVGGNLVPNAVRLLTQAHDRHPDEFTDHETVFADVATNLDREDHRSMPQRNADALTDICRFWLDHNDDTSVSGGERPHITVVVSYATLSGSEQRLGEIDGSAVDPEAIRRLACDAGIVRIITDGESQPLDIGRRTRTVSPAMRRALELRDKGCTWAGCDAPASWCDAHHIIHWAHGGATSLINLILLCRRHHIAAHDGKHPPEP